MSNAQDKGTRFAPEQLSQLRALNKLVGDESLPEPERRGALKALAVFGGEPDASVGGIAFEDIKFISAYMTGLCLALDGHHRVITLNESVEFREEVRAKMAWENRHKV